MNCSLPTVSLIIPVYNAGQALRRCLDSIAAQETDKWEAICIDDGSNDGSEQVLDSYHKKDSRFVVIHQKNSGVSHARNVGIDTARGEYITFIDADDWVEPTYVSKLINGSDGGRFDYIAAGYEVCHVDGKHHRIDTISATEAEAEQGFSYAFLSMQSPYPWGKLLRRSILMLNGLRFIEDMKIGEDTLFCYRFLYLARSGAIVHEPLYHYYEGGGAWSRFARGECPAQDYRYLYRIVSFLIPAIQQIHEQSLREAWGKELLRQTYKLQNLLNECRIPLPLRVELKITGLLLACRLVVFVDKKLIVPLLHNLTHQYKSIMRNAFRRSA